MRRLVLFVMALLIGMWMVGPAIGAYTSDCEPCHAGTIDVASYEGSAHGANECTFCHKDYAAPPHTETAVDCSSCHGEEYTKDANWNAESHDVVVTAEVEETTTTSEPELINEDATENEMDGEGTPGFTAIIAVSGILAVAYLMRRH